MLYAYMKGTKNFNDTVIVSYLFDKEINPQKYFLSHEKNSYSYQNAENVLFHENTAFLFLIKYIF